MGDTLGLLIRQAIRSPGDFVGSPGGIAGRAGEEAVEWAARAVEEVLARTGIWPDPRNGPKLAVATTELTRLIQDAHDVHAVQDRGPSGCTCWFPAARAAEAIIAARLVADSTSGEGHRLHEPDAGTSPDDACRIGGDGRCRRPEHYRLRA